MFKRYILSTGEILHVSLLSDITDTCDLKMKITDQSLKCCCITPSLILDTFQIAVAADKACLARSRDKLVTKNINTEILYNLSLSKHISKSLLKFGVQANDTYVIAAMIGTEKELNIEVMKIRGNPIDLAKLDDLVDKEAVNKEYNITTEELKSSPHIDSVVTRIATKNF